MQLNASERLSQAITAVIEEAVSKIVTAPAEAEWRLLSAAEAGERLGRSESWVRERARTGQLPYVRLDGGPRRFRLEDLQAYAASHVVGSPLLRPLAPARQGRSA